MGLLARHDIHVNTDFSPTQPTRDERLNKVHFPLAATSFHPLTPLMAKKILEVVLENVSVRNDGDEKDGEVGDNILVAQLLFSRTLVSDVLVSTKALAMKPKKKGAGEQSVDLSEKSWSERILFKKWVEGPIIGLKLEVTDKDSGSRVAQFLLEAVGGLMGTGGTALKASAAFIPFSGLPIDAVVSFARAEVLRQGEKAGADKVLSLGEGYLDIPADQEIDWTPAEVTLIASRDLHKIIYVREKDPIASKPQWRTRVDKKVVVKAGSPNGSVGLKYRVYREE